MEFVHSWIHIHIGYNAYAPNTFPLKSLNLSVVVLCNNFTFHEQKWIIKDRDKDWQILCLEGRSGDIISLGCFNENYSEYATALHNMVEYTGNKPRHDFDHTRWFLRT